MEDNTEQTGIIGKFNIRGLDTSEGMSRVDDDEELYLFILNSFITHAPKFIETVRNYNDLEELRIAVHTMKGSGRGIGAYEIGNMAEKLEKAALNKDIAYIEANAENFISIAENLISSIKALL